LTNLYYTQARFDTAFGLKDTDDLSEGAANFYYTEARFDTSLSGKSTTDLSEGTNLYFTDARSIASPLTGYVKGAGTVAATDSIIEAVEKLDGNLDNKLETVDLTSDVTGILPLANGGTGSATQNFVDLSTNQTVNGEKTFGDDLDVTTANISVSDGSGNVTLIKGDSIDLNTDGSGGAATTYIDFFADSNFSEDAKIQRATGANGQMLIYTRGTGDVAIGNITSGNYTFFQNDGDVVARGEQVTVGNKYDLTCYVTFSAGAPIATGAGCSRWVNSFTDTATGAISVNFTVFATTPECTCTADDNFGVGFVTCNIDRTKMTSSAAGVVIRNNSNALVDIPITINCSGD
jgi:hypothetical protein